MTALRVAIHGAAGASHLRFCDGLRLALFGWRSRTQAVVVAAGRRYVPELDERARRERMRKRLFLLVRWMIAAAVLYGVGMLGRRGGWIPAPLHVAVPGMVLLGGVFLFLALHAEDQDLEKTLSSYFSRFYRKHRSKHIYVDDH